MKSQSPTMNRTASILAVLCGVALLMGTIAPAPAAAADSKDYPVLLIHGLASDTSSWKQFPTYLENRGHDVFVMDFDAWEGLPFAGRQLKDYRYLAALIARQTAEIRSITGKPKVNIIAHSIAGLAVRAYIAGLGEKIETRGRYSNDVNRVVYLDTPFFGVANTDKNFKTMLKDTDWGVFLDSNYIFNTLRGVGPDLMEIHDSFMASRAAADVEELTVYSEQDNVVRAYQANLDGLKVDSFQVLRTTARNPTVEDSRHLTVKQFAHAYHDLLGRPKKTILGVASKDHAALIASTSFFAGTSAWRNLRVNINGDNETLVILRIASGAGLSLKDLKPGAVELKRVGQKSKKVRMDWQSDAEFFTFTASSGGTFELSYLPIEYYSFRFNLTIYRGMTQFATFDLKNPPFDPEYEYVEGDERISPGAIPSAITDYASLRRFVLAAFPIESRIYRTSRDMTPLVKRVRNALVATYPNLSSKNDVDKFGLSEDEYVDFVKDADSSGVFANKIEWNYTKIEKPEDPGNGGGGGGGGDYTFPDSPPSSVYNSDTLEHFVLWYLREDATKYATNHKDTAARVRDKLDSMYSDICRVNEIGLLGWVDKDGKAINYTASDSRHTDAFVHIGQQRIVDFVSGVDAPGKFIDKVMYLKGTLCPGGQILPDKQP